MTEEKKTEPKVEVKEEPKRQPSRSVVVIDTDGTWSLVEWQVNGKKARTYVLSEAVDKGKVNLSTLMEGKEYGEDWSKMIQFTVTADRIDARWKEMGIWTDEDMKRDWQPALRAVFGMVKEDLVKILQELARR